MAKSKLLDDPTWCLATKLGLTRIPTPNGFVELFPSGELWEELRKRLQEICRNVVADPEIHEAINYRVGAEMRGEVDVVFLPLLQSPARDPQN